MGYSDYHVHTTFSDGKSSPEEVVLKAISMGMNSIGFSDHAYTSFDAAYCMKKSEIENYKRTINDLRIRYSDKIIILLGIEQDIYSDLPAEGYDYVIGSAHYLKIGSDRFPVDAKPELFRKICNESFGGDYYLMAEQYYEQVSTVTEATDCNIIGHFDLVTKFNEKFNFFDETDERYRNAWKKCADRLIPYGIPFEINTGAISRAWRTTPYPSSEIINYLKDNGAEFIYSSDSHHKDTICYEFDRLESFGYKSIASPV